MKSKHFLISFALVSLLCFSASAGTYSGGSGTSLDPYKIADINDLLELSATTGDYSKNFILIEDINLIGRSFNKAVIYGPFDGTFDGNGHVISNLTVRANSAGLFREITSNGAVKKLGIEDANMGSWGINYNDIGVLAYRNSGLVSSCYSTGVVKGRNYVGGLIASNSGYVENCYSLCFVDGSSSFAAGGLIGTSYYYSIKNCYSAGVVIGNPGGGYYSGGLIGCGGDEVYNSFWDINTSGILKGVGGLGLSTEQMKNIQTYAYNGWGGEAWTIKEGDYPRLAWENKGGQSISEPDIQFEGAGTSESPYLINDVNGLYLVSIGSIFWDKCFTLASDIDANNISVRRIGYDKYNGFKGVFDGNGHVISNIKINLPESSCVGVFGYTDVNSIIKNLGIEDVNIIGNSYVGSLIGRNYGKITQCYSSGSVTGEFEVGGFVGENGNPSGVIENCYSHSKTIGDNTVGGFVGRTFYNLRNCYSTGKVSGEFNVYGFMGSGSNLSGCVWDVNTSGTSAGANGSSLMGLTTIQMQNIISGWDFYGETANGTEDIWMLPIKKGYPCFMWQVDMPAGYADGDGSSENPFQIANAEQFWYLGWDESNWDKNFELVSDINLLNIGWRPIGKYRSPFSFEDSFIGKFNGNGHIIFNVGSGYSSLYFGLFGFIGKTGEVKKLGLQNVNIIGYNYGGYIGSLAGINAGLIKQCYSSGNVSCDDTLHNIIGGLVGSNGGTISGCYTKGYADGGYISGGIAGSNSAKIEISYSNCSVSGIIVGGLVGDSRSFSDGITHCYSTGMVDGSSKAGGVIGSNVGFNPRCFWDVNTSGTIDGVANMTPDPSGVIGLATIQMQDINTYVNAGWDFDYTDGDAADWFMQFNEYPILTWQISPADLYTDGRNNFKDFSIFASYWQRKDCGIYNNYCDWADMDFSGDVGIEDLIELMTYWLQEGIYE